MKTKSLLVLALLMVVGVALTACGPSEPPADVLMGLLNEQHGVDSGEYAIHGMVECRVEADDAKKNWSVRYTPLDVDGAEELTVRVILTNDGEWRLSEEQHCILRF